LQVVGVLGQLGRHDYLLTGGDCLGVVALHAAPVGMQEAAVGIGDVGGRPGIGRLVTRAELELTRRLALGGRGDGAGSDPLRIALLTFGRLRLQVGLGLSQPRQPIGLATKGFGQLAAAGVAEELVFMLVGLGGLAQDLGDLGLELVEGAVDLAGL
jgi:hypothetical protein